MIPNMQKNKDKIVLSEYQFLHDYLRELRKRKTGSFVIPRSQSKKSLNNDDQSWMRRTKSMVVREKKVRYGLNKYDDPNTNIVKNEEKVLSVDGRRIKETKIKTIKRNKIHPDNKLPVYNKDRRKKILSKNFN
jgi:hypothetical protein